ncbi:hypothetical protein JXA27_01285 [Aerococcaceae bacterium zg-B36]|uniref:hypothetical protein n=1 Tax=Aerococcaceae bacterium zg-252 TaxID=2796928 RepID=UPI001BD854DD|nr:hypothetical protein [Aerococcaceae bacterium zg-B36]
MLEQAVIEVVKPLFDDYQRQIDELNQQLRSRSSVCLEGTQKHIRNLLGLTNVANLCKEFREYADKHPSVFGKYTPYYKHEGEDTVYYIPAILFFKMNKQLLLSGSKGLKLTKEKVDDIIERYRL